MQTSTGKTAIDAKLFRIFASLKTKTEKVYE